MSAHEKGKPAGPLPNQLPIRPPRPVLKETTCFATRLWLSGGAYRGSSHLPQQLERPTASCPHPTCHLSCPCWALWQLISTWICCSVGWGLHRNGDQHNKPLSCRLFGPSWWSGYDATQEGEGASKGVCGGHDMSRVAEWVFTCRWNKVHPLSEAWFTWEGVVQQKQNYSIDCQVHVWFFQMLSYWLTLSRSSACLKTS